MRAPIYSTAYLTNSRKVERALTVHDVDRLRDTTNIGDEIKFCIKTIESIDGHCRIQYKTVKGIVTAKYDHVFVLDNKYTYDWKQYLLNKVN